MDDRAWVFTHTGKRKPVRNLRWLLNHIRSSLVVATHVVVRNDGTAYMVVLFDKQTSPKAARFECEWADSTVLWEWMHRRLFITGTLYWGTPTATMARVNQPGPAFVHTINTTKDYGPPPRLVEGVWVQPKPKEFVR